MDKEINYNTFRGFAKITLVTNDHLGRSDALQRANADYETMPCLRGIFESHDMWCPVCNYQHHANDNFGPREHVHVLKCCGSKVHTKCLSQWFVGSKTPAMVLSKGESHTYVMYSRTCPYCARNAEYFDYRPQTRSSITHIHDTDGTQMKKILQQYPTVAADYSCERQGRHIVLDE